MEWIKVTDKQKPDDCETILLWVEHHEVKSSGYYSLTKDKFVSHRLVMDSYEPTHWAYFPAGPKKTQKTWQYATTKEPNVWVDATFDEYGVGKELTKFLWREIEKQWLS